MHAMALLMCHTHYTLTQPETLGLIDDTLPNKNLKTSSRVYTLRHCNALGCEYGRRETLVQCCSNAGPPSSKVILLFSLI